jgi:uncharacterized protein (DUF58 family)
VSWCRRGLAAAAAGLALTLVALSFEVAPLFVPGVAFAVLGLLVPGWVWMSSRPVTVRRRLHAERVVEGEPLEATVEVTRGVLGLPGAVLSDPLAGRPIGLTLPPSLIQGTRSASVRIVTRFARRGLHRLEEPELLVRDPLDLATVTRGGGGPGQELLVLPRTEPVRWRGNAAGHALAALEGQTSSEPQTAVEIDGLRPYRPGTPASRIHWPALARGAGLLERRLRADRDVRPVVVMDARGAHSDEHLDAAIRAAASLTLELARRGGCRLLLPGERRARPIEPDLVGWPAAHARLALVESGPTTKPPLIDAAARLGSIFYVAARAIERVPSALRTSGRGTVFVVAPRDLTSLAPGAASFEVAGCYGLQMRQQHGEERAA